MYTDSNCSETETTAKSKINFHIAWWCSVHVQPEMGIFLFFYIILIRLHFLYLISFQHASVLVWKIDEILDLERQENDVVLEALKAQSVLGMAESEEEPSERGF